MEQTNTLRRWDEAKKPWKSRHHPLQPVTATYIRALGRTASAGLANCLSANAQKRFRLNVAKERLTSAPGFDPDNWPDTADVALSRAIHDYHGVTPFVDTVVLRPVGRIEPLEPLTQSAASVGERTERAVTDS